MITQIGIIAGKILLLLEESCSPLSIRQIKKALKEPEDMVCMSLGWLLRERYISEAMKEGEVYIGLDGINQGSKTLSAVGHSGSLVGSR
jgi:hypothetical protein